MSASGAGVLQLRSVEYARNHGVRIHCRSSFDDGPGTVVQDEDMTMERPLVTAVTHSTSEARITLIGLPDKPGIAAAVLSALAEANVNVDMIIQNEPASEGHLADMSFTVPRDDLLAAREALEPLKQRARLRRHPVRRADGQGLARRRGNEEPSGRRRPHLQALGDAGVNIEMISTSPIKISCVVREEHVETAVRELHARLRAGRGRGPARGRGRRPPSQGQLVRVAVVGATGAVGSTMLGVMRERSFPADEIVPFASERSAGRTIDYGDQDLTVVRARRGRDPGLRPRAVLGRLGDQRRVGAEVRRGRRRRGRQLVALAHARRRAAGRLRGQPGGARRPSRHRRQPQLHDHADGRGAQADPRRGRHRAARDVHLPGGVRHRPAGGRGAARRRPRR